jgi:hypothetical protein
MADLSQTARDPRGDFVQATPRNPVLGFLSDIVGASYSPQRTQQMQGTARFLNAPAISETLNRLAYGEPLTTGAGGLGGTTRVRPEALEAGLALTDFLPSGAAAKSAAFAVPALAGIFVGPKAKTWDALAAQKAKMLADMGTDPKTIWQQTGTWKGPDGKWRQEIDDSSSKMTSTAYSDIKQNQRFSGPMSQAFENKPLYEAYPQLQTIDTFVNKDLKGGVFNPERQEITIMMPTEGGQRTVALHELQHAVQQQEGFARGGMPSYIGNLKGDLRDLEDKYNYLGEQYFNSTNEITKSNILQELDYLKPRIEALQKVKNLDPEEGYMRLAGEAEARATEARANLTSKQRRSIFPEESFDRPMEQLIIRNR